MSFWSNLQSKSSATKTQYAFGIASAITGIIAIFWISTLSSQFSGNQVTGKILPENENSLSELLNDASAQLGNVIETAKDNQEMLDNSDVARENLNALSIKENFSGTATSAVISNEEHALVDSNTALVISPNSEEVKDWAGSIPDQTTEKKKVLIEVSKVIPKTILIATTSKATSE